MLARSSVEFVLSVESEYREWTQGGRVTKKAVALLALLILQAHAAQAQSAMPTNSVLLRTLMVESQYGRGSIFSLDVDQREYWITAKHILTGAKHPPYGSIATKSVSLKILAKAKEEKEEAFIQLEG
jgi:hypothetical protein